MTQSKDVTKAIQARSDQLNADDLIGGPITIKITDVNVHTGDQPIAVSYAGDNGRPWKPCKTAARCLAAIWGPNAAEWVGLSCTIYNDPTVTWAGAAVGGIRVSHMVGLDKPRSLQLAKTRGKKGAVTIKPLAVETDTPPADAPDNTAALKAARDAAKKGSEVFRKWWTDNAGMRDAAKTIIKELQKTASDADAAMLPPDDEVPM
jgi:hypothetical protein